MSKYKYSKMEQQINDVLKYHDGEAVISLDSAPVDESVYA